MNLSPPVSTLPILYSFRRCPYAIRARMALVSCGIAVEHREVLLRNKPQAMLDVSPKGTVPVLVTASDGILDESLDIMRWALAHGDPEGWLNYSTEQLTNVERLIDNTEQSFKPNLDRFKYGHDLSPVTHVAHRDACEGFLASVDTTLAQSDYLHGDHLGFADVAIFPFVRQFANVEPELFQSLPYPRLIRWLNVLLDSSLFGLAMRKHALWQPGK